MGKLTQDNDNYRCGVGQLSIVEHALCPLDSRTSLQRNQTFVARYSYYDSTGARNETTAQVHCPRGLSASDEFYLWGLLALTLGDPAMKGELKATPHWCLKKLGLIGSKSRGGRQYQKFFDALQRLSAVKYVSNAFYDPVKKEHRNISFGFLSFSLPVNLDKDRSWKIVWDPLFLQMAGATKGAMRFDLNIYRELDPASRRLFLFLSKAFSRVSQFKAIQLDKMAVDLLGFSSSLDNSNMKTKVSKCLKKLKDKEFVSSYRIFKTSRGRFFVSIKRGVHFENQAAKLATSLPIKNSQLFDSLVNIGFEPSAAGRLARKYPVRLLEEWIEITNTALTHFGSSFFHKSPMAFFVNSVSEAANGNRTAPDWWHEISRREKAKVDSAAAKQLFEKIQVEMNQSPTSETTKSHIDTDLTRLSDVLKTTTLK